MLLFHNSGWTFDTSAGGGGGGDLITVSGGFVRLKDPGGTSYNFIYGGIGVALSTPSLKIPGLPAIKLPSMLSSGSTTDYTSNGAVFRKSVFSDRELMPSDFRGSCMYIEGGGGILKGASFDLMLFGANATLYNTLRQNPNDGGLLSGAAFLATCNGALMWAGANVGAQAGAGIGGLIGTMT